MLAKVIAHGATREEARRRLITALEDTVALGLTTNRSFLIAVLRHPAFAAGEATTAFIDLYFPAEAAPCGARRTEFAHARACCGVDVRGARASSTRRCGRCSTLVVDRRCRLAVAAQAR